MEIVYVYTKQRKNFGRHCKFEEHEAESLCDIAPSPAISAEYIARNPCGAEVQCSPECSEHDTNTDRSVLASQGTLHLEGGWPKDVDSSEVEQKIRYRKKVEKDEEYARTVRSLSETIEHCIKQNNSIDIYQEYFSGSAIDHASEPPSAKTITVLRDPSPIKRTATHLSWMPSDGKKIAVAYSVLQFQHTPEGMSHSSYIWDLYNPNTPEMEILPPSPLCCIEYNGKDPHLLVGGSYNGLISYWDTRKGSSAVDSSPIEKSHRDPVYDVKWLQSKTGTECMSVSTDGQVLMWDIRRLNEPLEAPLTLEPRSSEGISGILGGVSLDYDPQTAGPSKFMVGTEQGVVLSCNRKAKTAADRIGIAYSGHHGPIYAVQRNAFNTKFFLTVGDWTARIWNEEIRTPIMTTRYHTAYLTDGCWSPSRPGVFFTTKMDGTLDIWDYMYKQNSPVLSVQVADAGLHSIRINEDGRMIAVGGVDGTVSLLELSDSLSVLQPNEKNVISQMLDRETKREKALEQRAKELRQKQKQNKDRGDDVVAPGEAEAESSQFQELTDEFFSAVRKAEADASASEAALNASQSVSSSAAAAESSASSAVAEESVSAPADASAE